MNQKIIMQAYADKFDKPRFGMVRFQKDELFGYINFGNGNVIDSVYEDATDFNDLGIAFVQQQGQWLKINRNGQKLNVVNKRGNENPVDMVSRLFSKNVADKKIEIYQSNFVNYRYESWRVPYFYRPISNHNPYRAYKSIYLNRRNFGFNFGTQIIFRNGKIYGAGRALITIDD